MNKGYYISSVPMPKVGDLIKICKTLYKLVECSSEDCDNITLHNLTDKRFKFDNLRCRECGVKFAFDYDKAKKRWEEKFEKSGI